MIVAILQARCSSRRLPGKVLRPILGQPMIGRHIERLRRCTRIDRLIVATSREASDDPLAAFCATIDVDCFRGALDDVLDRFQQAAETYAATQIVRLTGDCPLADPALIDRLIKHHLDGGYDYSSTGIAPSFPDGLDAEIMTRECLEAAWKNARLPSEREHVTYYIYSHGEKFRIGSVTQDVDMSARRWTVDEPEDLEMVRRVYQALYPANPVFNTAEIVAFLDRHPEIEALNAGFVRNEGLARSLEQDKTFLAATKDKTAE